jgi:hypothetical protein
MAKMWRKKKSGEKKKSFGESHGEKEKNGQGNP